MVKTITIVGANLAGGRAAETLREEGFDGKIFLVGEEPWRPYERPLLSKEFLWDNTKLPDTFFLHDDSWYSDKNIDMRLGERAEALDLAAGGVRLGSGEFLKSDKILLATGGRARVLPLKGSDAPNVHYLRTKDDADRLAYDLKAGAHIVIIGMGVIGCEVAASAKKAGCDVTTIEPADVPMGRALGQKFGDWLGRYHRSQGVRSFYGLTPSELELNGEVVCAVKCNDGTRIECDAIVVGVGIVPNMELAQAAGVETSNGIVVDQQCRSNHSHIFAAGDVAFQPSFFGGKVRLETYQNASEQAAAAARSMIGIEQSYLKPGAFWSDQYDLNMQAIGMLDDSLEIAIRGSLDENKFTAFFLNNSVVSGVLMVNTPSDMGAAKRLTERRISADFNALSDPSVSLRTLLKP